MSVVVGFVDTAEGRAALDAGAEEVARTGSTPLIVVALSNEDVRTAVIDRLASTDDVTIVEFDGADATEHLLQVAEQHDAQLIVIGLRRRSNVGKLILGAHAQRVLLDAPCPVLTVKAAENAVATGTPEE